MNAKRAAKPAGYRYQVRLGIDDQEGGLWRWIADLPDRSRPRAMIYLMQLGLTVHRSLENAGALGLTQAAPLMGTSAQGSAEPSSPAGEATAAKLSDYNLDAFNF